MKDKYSFALNVETLILVAIWERPSVFQGCFKITELHKNMVVLFFFRCIANHDSQSHILNHGFSPEHFKFTHLYRESELIELSCPTQAQEDALYLLSYALHVTLKEMLFNTKLASTSIDDVAMQAFINQVKPILNKDFTFPEEEHLGFAVAMDYCPTEETGLEAGSMLLNKFKYKIH